MIENVIAVANGKGGCGKTTLTANLAGYAALAGWRVLLVELDSQGNLGLDLGAGVDWSRDGGRRLYDLIVRDETVEPLREVRPGIDALPAGRETENVETTLRDDERILAKRLRSLAGDYDLVLIDCPPATSSPVVRAALAAAHYVLIPTFRDRASMEGLVRMAEEFARSRSGSNPDLDLLGVALVNVEPRSVALGEIRVELEDALASTGGRVFSSVVRANAHAAEHARTIGVLMHEYEAAARSAEPFWVTLKAGEKRQSRRSWSKSAGKLAEDYQQLAEEILGEYTARSEAEER